MAETMFPLVIRIPAELHARIAALAEADSRTLSAMARLLIERGLSNTDQRNTAARKAMAQRRAKP